MNNTNNITNAIQTFIKKHNLIQSGSTIVVGLSGGPDSMFLLYFLHTLFGDTITLIAAHLDHQWRANSKDDVEFCRQHAQRLNIQFISTSISDLDCSFKDIGSPEALGRQARRYFFEQVKKQYHADAIALGHHVNDQEETFFIRLIRGTSLTGLCGMWPKHGDYIRPLLEAKKSDILAYLNDHNIPYLMDPTNESPDFLRNRIRSTILPSLTACDERFDANFLRTVRNLQETESFLNHLAQQTWQKIMIQPHGIDITQFHALPSVLQYRVLMHWLIQAQAPFNPAQSFLDEIMRFFNQSKSEHHIHDQWKIIKKNNVACIEKR